MALLPNPVRLPGVYFNIRSAFRTMSENLSPGIALGAIPIPWYLENTPVDIHVREYYDVNYVGALGFTAFDFNDPHEKKATALTAGATQALIFPMYTGGARACGEHDELTFTAARLGERGNSLRMNIVDTGEDFTVVTFFGTTPREVDIQQINTWDDYRENAYVEKPVKPSGMADYPAVAPGLIAFEGGTNGSLLDFSARLGAFLEQASYRADDWDVIAFSAELDDPQYLQARAAFRNWLNQLNSDEQRMKRAVMGITFENGIDNSEITQVDQEVQLNNVWYTLGESVLLRTGYAAGSLPNHNETNDILPDMTNVRPLRNHRQREMAIRRGVFSYVKNRDGRFKVEDDVNSFVTLRPDKNIQWTSNRVIRTLDTFMERVHRGFNTQIKGFANNNESGRAKFRAVINQVCEDFVSFGMMDEHDISKIRVGAGSGPRTMRVEFHDVVIVDSVRDADINMTITWAADMTL